MRYVSLVVVAMLIAAVGCERPVKTQPEIVRGIRTGTQAATTVGLNYLDKKDHKVCVKTAEELNKMIVEVVLPYLNNEAVTAATTVVEEVLKEKFFDKLDENIKLAIVSAATILDVYIRLPDPSQKLTEAELAYMKAFFEGVAAGADDFIMKPGAVVRDVGPKKRGWFR